MNRKIILSGLVLTLMSICMASCDLENPLDKEQYKKQIYIVGSEYKNEGHSTFDLQCIDDGFSQAYISVAMSGTLTSKNDVHVGISDDVPQAIENYNNIYLSATAEPNTPMPVAFYEVPSAQTTIKAGNVFAQFPINVRTSEIDCDKIYAIPFKITSVSEYEYRKIDTVLIMAFNLVNEYSQNYRLNAYRSVVPNDDTDVYTDSVEMGQLITLKAVSEKVVRFYGEGKSEEKENIDDYCLTLNVGPDNSVTVSAWDDSKLTVTDGSGYYDPQKKTFHVEWKYVRDGVKYHIGGTFVNQKGQLSD